MMVVSQSTQMISHLTVKYGQSNCTKKALHLQTESEHSSSTLTSSTYVGDRNYRQVSSLSQHTPTTCGKTNYWCSLKWLISALDRHVVATPMSLSTWRARWLIRTTSHYIQSYLHLRVAWVSRQRWKNQGWRELTSSEWSASTELKISRKDLEEIKACITGFTRIP